MLLYPSSLFSYCSSTVISLIALEFKYISYLNLCNREVQKILNLCENNILISIHTKQERQKKMCLDWKVYQIVTPDLY